MAEYIEKEKATLILREEAAAHYPTPYHVGLYAAARAIESIPAADVRPVVRGKWIKARGSWCTPGGDPVWECSECGKGRHVYGIEHGSYGADVADGQWVACPNCGADMRETNDEKA